jgi:RecJ-like exonuclease
MAWKICPRCEGDGKVVHPACSVWTQEDRYNDPDGFDEMMEGAYDVTCQRCGGTGKVRSDGEDEDGYSYAERLADAKLRGMEDGDPELYYNPELGLY